MKKGLFIFWVLLILLVFLPIAIANPEYRAVIGDGVIAGTLIFALLGLVDYSIKPRA